MEAESLHSTWQDTAPWAARVGSRKVEEKTQARRGQRPGTEQGGTHTAAWKVGWAAGEQGCKGALGGAGWGAAGATDPEDLKRPPQTRVKGSASAARLGSRVSSLQLSCPCWPGNRSSSAGVRMDPRVQQLPGSLLSAHLNSTTPASPSDTARDRGTAWRGRAGAQTSMGSAPPAARLPPPAPKQRPEQWGCCERSSRPRTPRGASPPTSKFSTPGQRLWHRGGSKQRALE